MKKKKKMKKENNFFVNEVRKQAFSRSLKRYRKEWNLTRGEIIRNLNIKSYRDITQDFDEEVSWDERERKLNRWENGESFPTFEKIDDMIKESPKFAKVFNEEIDKVAEEIYYFYKNIFQTEEKTVDFFEAQALQADLPEATDELYYDNKQMLMALKDRYDVQFAVNKFLKKED